MLGKLSILLSVFLLVVASCGDASLAQSSTAEDDSVQLPTDSAAWLNSPPIPIEMLKGKAAVFYFFEEG